MGDVKKSNIGTSFDSFLEEEGIMDDVDRDAQRRIKKMKGLRFRIVKCGPGAYFVQRRRWFGWETQCGYHRGAPGDFAYRYCEAANPYALIDHTIPDLISEFEKPTLPKARVREMRRMRAYRLRGITGVVDLERATRKLLDHQATNPPHTEFVPPGDIPMEWEVSM